MKYELLKQLKEAGFPIKTMGELIGDRPNTDVLVCYRTVVVIKDILDSNNLVEPPLSELIEACGDRFGGLEHWPRCKAINEQWECYSEQFTKPFEDKDYVEFVVYGSTPEEAVAKLWLELNKK